MPRSSFEIERKWLVEDLPDLSGRKADKILQGYVVVSSDGSEVRLRRKGSKFFQTIKTGKGLQRCEIEIELSKQQLRTLWPATLGRRLEKVRYTLKWQGKKIELDVYKKQLVGLRVVEVEFKSEKEAGEFVAPPWFGEEVTGKDEYKNANLALR